MNGVADKVFSFFNRNRMDEFYMQGPLLRTFSIAKTKPLSELVRNSRAVEQFFETCCEAKELALFGWVDQAFLEVDFAGKLSNTSYETCLNRLDLYRPDQNGDMVLAIAESEWTCFLALEFSFDVNRCEVSVYRRR